MDGEAEKRLLAAVFARAVRDLLVYRRGRTDEERQLAEAARAWLFEGADDETGITSFPGICQVMNLDGARVRNQLRHMLPQAVAGVGSAAAWFETD
ncbi:MAG: hypothetical protein IPG96_18425 [Proteobacteria bacterium]|nr:hypothetical protein [Pseudomonadota bacterium]